MTQENGDMHIKLEELHPNPYQPPTRLKLTEEKARKGGESILRSGLIQIPVCRVVDKGNGVIEYQIGDGWQRHEWFAWLVKNGQQGYDRLPVTFRPLTDQQMADLIEETDENKEKLNVMEKAWLWKKKLADFKNLTQADIAKQREISQGDVANTIRLLELPEEVQQMIITQEITATHGRTLLQLKKKALMLEYAGTAIKNGWTVATLDEVIKVYLDKQKPKMDMPAKVEEKQEEKAKSSSPAKTEAVLPVKEVDEKDGEEEIDTGDEAGESGGSDDEAAGGTGDENSGAGGVSTGGAKQGAAEKGKKKEPAKKVEPAKTKPATQKPVSVATVAKWKRKLILEETAAGVSISIMADGKFPVMKTLPGTFESVFESPSISESELDAPIMAFLAETNAKWEGK